jgi:hypothetical protein
MDSPRAAVSMDSPKASALEFGVWNKLGKSLESEFKLVVVFYAESFYLHGIETRTVNVACLVHF